MAVVTLTGHLGSMGNIGPALARSLGYRLVDRELVTSAAEALGWSDADVEAFDEKTGGLGRQISDFLVGGMSRVGVAGNSVAAFALSYQDAAAMTYGEQYLQALRAMLGALADDGNVVIVGRGGQAFLADREDAVHIRIACPVEERIRRIAVRSGVDMESARLRVTHSDREREAWHRRYAGIDYQSPYHYALVVNSGVLSESLTVGLMACVVEAYEQRLASRAWSGTRLHAR